MNANCIGIYIHIPFCASRCAYCDFVSGCDLSLAPAYTEKLIGEIRNRKTADSVDTVYIGGGTPSMLPSGSVQKILDCVRGEFNLDQNAEITVEANPDSASRDFLKECRSSGVNRLSLGLQTANDSLLKRVNRPHTYEDFLNSFLAARAEGFDNISADVMLGLPGQTEKDVRDTVLKLLALSPEHISVYSLKVEEGTPLARENYRPDEDKSADMYELCALLMKGYHRYEVSNFCKEKKRSRHNYKYWTRAPYLGFGAGAHSFYNGCRRENTPIPAKYLIADLNGAEYYTQTRLTQEDTAEEMLMLSLRTFEGLELEAFRRETGIDLEDVKSDEIKSLVSGGFIDVSEGRLRLTEDAYYVMNSIILKLMP